MELEYSKNYHRIILFYKNLIGGVMQNKPKNLEIQFDLWKS